MSCDDILYYNLTYHIIHRDIYIYIHIYIYIYTHVYIISYP